MRVLWDLNPYYIVNVINKQLPRCDANLASNNALQIVK